MNFLDIFLLFIFIKGAVDGYTRGIVTSAINVVGIIISIYAAIFYQKNTVDFLSKNFGLERRLAQVFNLGTGRLPSDSLPAGILNHRMILDMALNAIAFLVIFAGIQIIFAVAEYFIAGLTKKTKMSFLNRLSGAFLSLIAIALWLSIVTTAFQPFFTIFNNRYFWNLLNESKILNQLRVIDTIFPKVIKFI